MDPLAELSARVADIAASVARLEQRVTQLEQGRAPIVSPEPAPVERLAEEEETAASLPPGTALDLGLLGRSVIVLGGAYLLRALTELEPVPDVVGVALGLLYALTLLVLADRATARGATASGALHATTALVIAYPLLGEMTVRFRLADPWVASAAVGAFCCAALASAQRRRAIAIAWIAIVATLGAAVALAVTTRTLMPFLWLLVALVAGAGWLARRLRHRFLVWSPAIAADALLAGVLLFWRQAHPDGTGLTEAAVVVLVFFIVCAGGALARAVFDDARTTVFEMVQVSVAFAIGVVGGALLAIPVAGAHALAAVELAIAVAGTLAAVRGVGGRADRQVALAFWTTLWLALAMVALYALASGAPLASLYLAVAVAAVVLARRGHEVAELHAVVALAAAATTAGLAVVALRGLVGPPEAIAAPGAMAIAVLAALAVFLAYALFSGAPPWPPVVTVARVALLLVALVATAGLACWAVLALVGPARATTATIRTAILAAAAVALAALSRAPRARPARVLVYPVLAAGAAKLFFEDFVVGVAATHFVGLAVYGVALIVAPRLAAR